MASYEEIREVVKEHGQPAPVAETDSDKPTVDASVEPPTVDGPEAVASRVWSRLYDGGF